MERALKYYLSMQMVLFNDDKLFGKSILHESRGQFHQRALTRSDPEKRKKMLDLTVFLRFLGSSCVKAARKMLVKLTPRVELHFLKSLLLWDDHNYSWIS